MVGHHLAKGLAFAFLAGPWTEGGMVTRGWEALGGVARGRPRWMRKLVRRLLEVFPAAPIDRDDELAGAIAEDRALRGAAWGAWRRPLTPTLSPRSGEREKEVGDRRSLRIQHWHFPEPMMVPVEGPPARFRIPPLPTPGDLAGAIGLRAEELAWFADERRLNAGAAAPKLSHYHHRWIAKARGGWRLLEAPKPRLKRIQRWLLDNLLAPIPPSDVAHGFVDGRSVRTFVAPHVGRPVIVRLDLRDFFASVSRARVAALFRRVGYPRLVAAALAGLCTAPTPERVLREHPRTSVDLAQRFLTNARLKDAHLPQGAPTSPALSNLAAWRLDRRLAALAAGFGARMTRYADDLAFSGDEAFGRALRFFVARVAAIALEEGFAIHHRKTRVMRRGRRQTLCGVVVNDTANLPRRERDRLRATLHNAARLGLPSQNRDGRPDFRRHLEGRVAWAASLNPAFGKRVKRLLDQIG